MLIHLCDCVFAAESAMEVDQTVTEQEDKEDEEMMSQGEDNNG